MRLFIMVVAVTAIVVSTTGCMGVMSTPSGIREYFRGQNGGLNIAKRKNDQSDSHYEDVQRATDYNALSALKQQLNDMQEVDNGS